MLVCLPLRESILTETKRASKEETDYAPEDSLSHATKGTALTSTTLKADAKLAKVSENLVKLKEEIGDGGLGKKTD